MKLIDNLIQKWAIKCIIFDLDGTIVDTLDKHIEAFNILFNQINQKISYENIALNMGRTPKDTLLTLIPELENNKSKLEDLAIRKETLLTTLLKDIPKLPGSFEILNYLKKMNLKLCLASSTPKYNVTKIINETGFTDFFDVIITGEDITVGKPNPEVFLKAIEKVSIKPEFCAIIGDSPHDIEAAKIAGIKIIAVTTGKHSINQIRKAKPDYLVSSLNELLQESKKI